MERDIREDRANANEFKNPHFRNHGRKHSSMQVDSRAHSIRRPGPPFAQTEKNQPTSWPVALASIALSPGWRIDAAGKRMTTSGANQARKQRRRLLLPETSQNRYDARPIATHDPITSASNRKGNLARRPRIGTKVFRPTQDGRINFDNGAGSRIHSHTVVASSPINLFQTWHQANY